YQMTSPYYFKVMGTRIIRGRAFTVRYRDGAPPVAVVSDAMARALWPGQDAIGQCLHIGAHTVPCTTVIGIAEDAVQYSISDTERLMYYVPDEQPLFDPVRKVAYGARPGNRILLRMS